jgi:hypothetical protein
VGADEAVERPTGGLLYGLDGESAALDVGVDGDLFAGVRGQHIGIGDGVDLLAVDHENRLLAALDALLRAGGVIWAGDFVRVVKDSAKAPVVASVRARAVSVTSFFMAEPRGRNSGGGSIAEYDIGWVPSAGAGRRRRRTIRLEFSDPAGGDETDQEGKDYCSDDGDEDADEQTLLAGRRDAKVDRDEAANECADEADHHVHDEAEA